MKIMYPMFSDSQNNEFVVKHCGIEVTDKPLDQVTLSLSLLATNINILTQGRFLYSGKTVVIDESSSFPIVPMSIKALGGELNVALVKGPLFDKAQTGQSTEELVDGEAMKSVEEP